MGIKRSIDDHDAPSGQHTKSAETDHPRKRRQTFDDVDTRLAHLYSDLADDVKSTRLEAGKTILAIVAEADQDRVDKIIHRLVRGLCSSRKAARLGFVVILTEVISRHCAPAEDASLARQRLEALARDIESITATDDAGTNQEKKDYHLGRCLAFKAIVQSNVILKLPLDSALPSWKSLLDRILLLHKQAPSIRQECGSTANGLLSIASAPVELAETLLQSYGSHSLLKSPEGLSAWLQVRRRWPKASLPSGVWHKNDPLASKSRQDLISVLRDNSTEQHANSEVAAKVGGNPQSKSPDSAWPIVLQIASESMDAQAFAQFWKEVVDDAFFSAKASIERKAIGLQIMQLAITTLPSTLLDKLFSPNITRCIVNQRSSSNNNLFSACNALLRSVTVRARSDSPAAVPLMRAIITGAGLPNFDRVTQTKTIDELLACVPVTDMEAIMEIMNKAIEAPLVSEHLEADTSRRSTADLILNYARKQVATKTTGNAVATSGQTTDQPGFEWRPVLQTLLVAAYLDKSSHKPSPISKSVKEVFQSRLMSVLNFILDSKQDPAFDLPPYIVSTLRQLASTKEYTHDFKADKEVQDTISSAYAQVGEIEKQLSSTKVKASKRPTLSAFRLLFSLSLLQVYNGDTDALSILDDLLETFQEWSQSKSSVSSIVEILLGYLSRPSSLFRKLAEQVFAAIASSLEEDSMASLVDILSKPENLSGQQELFENADEEQEAAEASDSDGPEGSEDTSSDSSDSDDESDSDISGEDASDVEMLSANGDAAANESDSDASSSSSGSSSSSSAPPADDDDELLAFETKLAQTLGTRPTTQTTTDGSSSSDSDMDDEQMLALDSHLVNIFQQRRQQTSSKKTSRDARGTVVAFKTRVLDLLAIYARTCPSSPLALRMLLPLLALVRTTATRALADRAANVCRAWFDACNKAKTFPVDAGTEVLLELLEGVFAELRQVGSKAHGALGSRAGLFVVKTLVVLGMENYEAVATRYAALQAEWYADPACRVPPGTFTEFTSWSVNSRKS